MKATTTSAAFQKCGEELVVKKRGGSLTDEEHISFHGKPAMILSECWSAIADNLPSAARPCHLLWACMFMKLHLPELTVCVLVGTSKPTLGKWVWLVIEQLALHSVSTIKFDKRKRNLPKDALCSMSIDGTDFETQEPCPFNKKWCKKSVTVLA